MGSGIQEKLPPETVKCIPYIPSWVLNLKPHSTKSICEWPPQASHITYIQTKVALGNFQMVKI